MIELRSVCKTYGAKPVLDTVSLTIERGGLTSLIGPNGAGKSTLLGVISRLIPADSGNICVDGLDICATPSTELAKKLSVLRQENTVNCRISVRDLVSFGRYPHSLGHLTATDNDHIENTLRYLELEHYQNRFLDELSGGQRQRAFIAMILCQNTDYILLDEPLNNLDIKHAAAMMKLLRRTVRELQKTVIIVLHDINFASCYSDTIIAMRGGRIIAQDSPKAIMQPAILQQIYDTDIAVTEYGKRPIALYYE